MLNLCELIKSLNYRRSTIAVLVYCKTTQDRWQDKALLSSGIVCVVPLFIQDWCQKILHSIYHAQQPLRTWSTENFHDTESRKENPVLCKVNQLRALSCRMCRVVVLHRKGNYGFFAPTSPPTHCADVLVLAITRHLYVWERPFFFLFFFLWLKTMVSWMCKQINSIAAICLPMLTGSFYDVCTRNTGMEIMVALK